MIDQEMLQRVITHQHQLINFAVKTLATKEEYYGYVEVGAKVIGKTSGATATITRAELISDNWGDVLAAFFFRDPNTNPNLRFVLHQELNL